MYIDIITYFHTLFPWGVNLIRVIPGPDPGWRRTDTGFGVPNSNIRKEPSALPVRSEWINDWLNEWMNEWMNEAYLLINWYTYTCMYVCR